MGKDEQAIVEEGEGRAGALVSIWIKNFLS